MMQAVFVSAMVYFSDALAENGANDAHRVVGRLAQPAVILGRYRLLASSARVAGNATEIVGECPGGYSGRSIGSDAPLYFAASDDAIVSISFIPLFFRGLLQSHGSEP